MSKNQALHMLFKHKLTMATAIFHGTMVMRVENN